MNPTWSELVDQCVAFRHSLHEHPELGWNETQTASAIRRELSHSGISWRACAGTGTVGVLAPQAPGRHIALRGDIDALPIIEAASLPWKSRVPGCMHACGHDGHTAVLLGAARWLKAHEKALPGPVTLLFQPAEEGGHGAKHMIEDGALEGVDAIFGWHNWPAIPFGKAVCPDGVVMAANGTFQIKLHGSGGHASQPECCRDPVLAASAVTLALQQIVSRRLPPQHAVVVSVTSIMAPSADTVIPGEALLGGSIRLSDSRLRGHINDLIQVTAEDAARAYGVRAEVTHSPRYDSTVNDPVEAALFRTQLHHEFGALWMDTDIPLPIMASEDFSYYLREVPGAFALIGANDGKGHDQPCHSAHYDFNDALVPHVMRLYARLAGAPVP